MSEEIHSYLNRIDVWKLVDGRYHQCKIDDPEACKFDVYHPGSKDRAYLPDGDHSFKNRYDAEWVGMMVRASFQAGIEQGKKEVREVLGIV